MPTSRTLQRGLITLKMIPGSSLQVISFRGLINITCTSRVIDYMQAQVISLKWRLIPLLLSDRAKATTIRQLTRQIVSDYVSTVFLPLSLNTQITRRDFLQGVIIPIPLTLSTSLKPKIRQLLISLELLEISLNTPFTSSLLISFLQEIANGSPGVVIMPLARSLTDICLSRVSFLVRKFSIVSRLVLLFIKNVIKI